MCGIVGYIGYKNAQPILLESLKRLEYRGYDSCGIASSGGSLLVHKNVGRIVSLEKTIPSSQNMVGIGHTRWATHGDVTAANSHPHLDCSGNIAVVHNGVIDNYYELRSALIAEGHKFFSDTDTEVIPHLIGKYYTSDLAEAVTRAIGDIKGTFGIIVLHSDHQELVVARSESPLIIGLGDKENFIASDMSALLHYTDKVIHLEEGDLGIVTTEKISVFNNGQSIQREKQVVPWSVEDTQKGGYEHFMLKEMHEQPKTIDQTLRGRISYVDSTITLEIRKDEFPKNILLLACGTSYNAALVADYVFSKLACLQTRAQTASEFNHHPVILNDNLVIGITQSGETIDTIRALQKARQAGCPTMVITNVHGSSVTRIVDQVFYTNSGPEISVAATKTFISQLTAIYLLALNYSPANVLDIRDFNNYIEEFRPISSAVQQVLDNAEKIKDCSSILSGCNSAFYIGRGINYPVAIEGALKLKEISYIHAEAYPAGELKHGPFALLRPNTPVIAVTTGDDTYEPMLTSIKEIKARGPQVIAIAREGDTLIDQFVDAVIRVPATNPMFSPFVNSVALQLLAYYAAGERGCSIDLPANLAKSVTVP